MEARLGEHHSFLWEHVAGFWWSLDRGIQSSLISAAATFITAGLGGCLVVWQIGRQAENAVRQNRHTEVLKLKVKLYESIVETCEAAVDASVRFSANLRIMKDEFALAEWQKGKHRPPVKPRVTLDQIQRLFLDCQNANIGIVTTVERWMIIDPRIGVFRSAMASALHDVRTTTSSQLAPKIAEALQLTDFPSPTGAMWIPNTNLIREIDDIFDRLLEEVMNLQSYCTDFQTEMQNILLIDLFNHPVAKRQPLDPTLITVTLEEHDAIERHLYTMTAWGRERQEVEARMRAQFTAKKGMPPTSG